MVGGPASAIGRQMEILLIEDNLVHARLAIRALEEVGIHHRLTLVRDGAEAADFLFRRGKFARAPRPDLILLDLRLPKLDGPDLLEMIRGDEDLTALPVVVMTASEEPEDRERCRKLRVDAYIQKPFDLSDLLGLVKKLRKFWHADVILPEVE